MPAAAIAIPMAISAGTSLIGGALKSRAANKAAKIQSEAAQTEATSLRDVLAQVNPQIGQAGQAAAEEVRGAAGQARTDALSANELLAPYLGAGAEATSTLRDLMQPGGDLNRTFTAADMEAYDPGYQFRINEAQKALQTSAAARGGVLGGGTLRALNQRVQDVASSEFGSAHDRFRQQQEDRYKRLFGFTELGSRAAGDAGRNLLTAGELGVRGATAAGEFGTRATQLMAGNALDTQRSISDLMTGGANARAAGTVGSANAWGGALAGVGQAAQAAGGYYQDRELLKLWQNPALKRNPSGPGFDPREPN
jgi:hypothetical protein